MSRPNPAKRPGLDTGLAEGFVLLDNSTGRDAVSLLFENPERIIRADDPEQVEDALADLSAGLKSGLHAAGFFSYELGYVLEPKLASRLPKNRRLPLLWFGLYAPPRELSSGAVQDWLADAAIGDPQLGTPKLAWDRDEYLHRFDQVIDNIPSGNIYQLNLTFKARFELQGSPLALYRDLRQKQRVLYGGLVDTGDATILSASPELFVEKTGLNISTRPMKGTAPRAGKLDDDKGVREMLSTDIKSRAENLMIVDLMRNDLGRIAELGSVQVTDLFTVETFKTLHQMTSGVTATLKSDVTLSDILRAIFPPGSITGAPKIRAMELINDLETEPRGIYCGSIGHLAPNGDALLNVVIRTAVIDRDGKGEIGIGSGVVADSDGPKEFAECLLKMKFLTDPVQQFELIETLLYEPETGYWLLDEHLERLRDSASYFGYKHDPDKISHALKDAVRDIPDQRSRVRLLLSEDGEVTTTVTELPAQRDPVMKYMFSDTPVNSTDLFLYHKTTRRELYDREWKEFSERFGADEVLYLNEKGELAEGSRTTIFLEIDGELYTPELKAGLLPGTLRSHLLATQKVKEKRLTLADVNQADAVFLGNSVRGLVRAEPVIPEAVS